MITKEQEEWLDHLSDTSPVKIAPFDPESGQKFERIKKEIQAVLGKETQVLHRGASAMGISGQPEVDIYIPVPPEKFDSTVSLLVVAFGQPYSAYALERTKFILKRDETKLEIMVVNEACKSWKDHQAFYRYVSSHPEALERYRMLKEEGGGLSNRAYYRKKIEFINEILEKAG